MEEFAVFPHIEPAVATVFYGIQMRRHSIRKSIKVSELRVLIELWVLF